MERVLWKGRLMPGKEQEYRKRHDEIWPEMTENLNNQGIRNYSTADKVAGIRMVDEDDDIILISLEGLRPSDNTVPSVRMSTIISSVMYPLDTLVGVATIRSSAIFRLMFPSFAATKSFSYILRPMSTIIFRASASLG